MVFGMVADLLIDQFGGGVDIKPQKSESHVVRARQSNLRVASDLVRRHPQALGCIQKILQI